MATASRPHLLRSALALLLSRRRATSAQAALAAQFDQQLLDAADAAVSVARRTLYDTVWPQLPPRERLSAFGVVSVEDVTDLMYRRHGIVAIPPERAAAALRARYEARSGRIDLHTDAYSH
ncbi:hypothetical protein [Streptomyces sp. NBC_01264]|uniref:hypothetical protein n=1 Tax=Streptomyces sp. NBC_01264 TaxID=2903804 RepID=UPI002252214D|nr:hypothetical protein [Streptomyces sp. NBC_01264]MCX4784139.1 hypothetical protein [Streptomyces sp. NBC_01264]